MTSRSLTALCALLLLVGACSDDDIDRGSGTGGTATGTGAGTSTGTSTGAGGTGTGGTSTGTAGSGGSGGASQGFACQYPGDVGIDGHASVVWAEGFEEGSVSAVVARYDSYSNDQRMTLEADVPVHSSGAASMRMTAGGGVNDTDLYKSFDPGFDDLYVRYYVKYQEGVEWHHTGMYLGGYNPPSPWPQGLAGIQPDGDDNFSVALEAFGPLDPDNGVLNPQLDFYNYWMQMHPGGGGGYWGNTLVHDTRMFATYDWQCVEVHVRLNPDPGSAAGAELGVWLEDVSIVEYNDQGPVGRWLHDKFCRETPTWSPSCSDYAPLDPPDVVLDLQSRVTTDLTINYLWMQNYITAGNTGDVWYDDVVLATERVGCICPAN